MATEEKDEKEVVQEEQAKTPSPLTTPPTGTCPLGEHWDPALKRCVKDPVNPPL